MRFLILLRWGSPVFSGWILLNLHWDSTVGKLNQVWEDASLGM